ncbi:MAG: phosphoribosyl-AMP cyclohydrolase [Ktedonobacteraceae bacterium]|nr:phosphoribosyl-AMP cyclohydrolase [Chloroflexota bacterium]
MLKFDRQGLAPAVIQDDATGDVLMVAFMNEEALSKTRETGYTHFYSRTRQAIWRKGEQSGNSQEVRAIFVNCEENSLLIHVIQHGVAACHEGYHSCYYRRLLPDGTHETVAERLFDPTTVYNTGPLTLSSVADTASPAARVGENEYQDLETRLRQLYGAYIYLRDHDLSEESNTSRLLQDHDPHYLLARLADELQELSGVQVGEHVHEGLQPDTIFEGSQVGYWLMLLASSHKLRYDDFSPHEALLEGAGLSSEQGSQEPYSDEKALEKEQECLNLIGSGERTQVVQGLRVGFGLIGWACAKAGVSPQAPADFDLEQMRRKGLVK